MPVVNIKPVLGDILQLRVACLAGGQLGLNVVHYRVTGVTTLGASVHEIAVAMDTTIFGAYVAWLPIPAEYFGVGVKILTPPATLEDAVTIHQQPGGNGTHLVPRQASGLIHFRTNLAGPANRGRIYVPFVAADALASNSELSVGGVAALTAIADAIGPLQTIVGGGGSTDLTLVIKHGPGPTNPPPSLASIPVVTMTASSSTATQKRRGDFGKPNSNPFDA